MFSHGASSQSLLAYQACMFLCAAIRLHCGVSLAQSSREASAVQCLAGIRVLEPALYCLRKLDLRSCSFGPEGASHIATVLKHADCKLQVLRLDGNNITGNSLQRGLMGNETLKELHLTNTNLSDAGACSVQGHLCWLQGCLLPSCYLHSVTSPKNI